MIGFQTGALDRTAVRERVDRVLAREEFRHSGSALSKWFGEKIHRISEWLGDLLGVRNPESARAVLVVFTTLLALLLVVSLARALARRRRSVAPASTGDRGAAEALRAASVAALRRAARETMEAGDCVGALRLYFRAIVVGLSERGDLRYREAWTNRELLERGALRRELLAILAPLVPRLDAQSFGREPAGPEDVARLAAICDSLLGGIAP